MYVAVALGLNDILGGDSVSSVAAVYEGVNELLGRIACALAIHSDISRSRRLDPMCTDDSGR